MVYNKIIEVNDVIRNAILHIAIFYSSSDLLVDHFCGKICPSVGGNLLTNCYITLTRGCETMKKICRCMVGKNFLAIACTV
jgi:hypothetical protein